MEVVAKGTEKTVFISFELSLIKYKKKKKNNNKKKKKAGFHSGFHDSIIWNASQINFGCFWLCNKFSDYWVTNIGTYMQKKNRLYLFVL